MMQHQRKNPSRKAGASLGSDGNSNTRNGRENPFIYRKAYQLPRGWKIEFCLDASTRRLDCEWEPAVPSGKLLRKIWSAYLAARRDFFAGLGETVLVIDL